MFIQGLGQFPHHMIHLEDEISMRSGLRLPLEILAGKGRQVNRLHGMKEEEWLGGFFLLVAFEKLEAFLQEDLVDFLQVKIRSDHPRAVVPGVRMFGQRTSIHDMGRRDGNTVAVQIGIEPIRGWTTCGAEEMIEASIDRSAFDGAGIVDQAHRIQPVSVDWLALLVKSSQSDVPLAEHRRFIAVVSEHARQGQAIRGDQTGSPHPGKDPLVIETKGHASRQHTVTGGRTNRGRTVGIGKKHSLLGQAVKVGRGDFRLRVIATDVSVPQIIRQNENNVGVRLGSSGNANHKKADPYGRSPEVIHFPLAWSILLFSLSSQARTTGAIHS